jgi:hypothetical protein
VDEYVTPIIGDHLLILFNADHATDIPFVLPKVKDAEPWERLLDTALESMDIDKPAQKGADMPKEQPYVVTSCSMAIFRAVIPKDPETNISR